jgi:hypothetical protein
MLLWSEIISCDKYFIFLQHKEAIHILQFPQVRWNKIIYEDAQYIHNQNCL